MQDPRYHSRRGSFAVAGDKDEELMLFHDLHRQERERKGIIDTSSGLSMTANSSATRKLIDHIRNVKVPDDLFPDDRDKSDYDWLLTPPSTPPASLLEFCELESTLGLNAVASSKFASNKWQNSDSLSRSSCQQSRAMSGNLGLLNKTGVSNTSARAVSGDSGQLYQSKVSSIGTSRRSFLSDSVGLPHSLAVRSAKNSTNIPSLPNCSLSTLRSAVQRPSVPKPASMQLPSGSARSRCPSASGLQNTLSVTGSSPTLVRSTSVSSGLSMTVASPSPDLNPVLSSGRSRNLLPPSNLRVSMPENAFSKSQTCGSKDSSVKSRRFPGSFLPFKGRLSKDTSDRRDATVESGNVLDGSNANARKVVEKEKKSKMVISPLQVKEKNQMIKSTPLKDMKARISSFRETSLNASNKNAALKRMDIEKNRSKGALASFISNYSAKLRNHATKRALPSRTSVTESPMATSSISSSDNGMGVAIYPENTEFCGVKVMNFTGDQLDDPLSCLFNEERITNWLSSPDFMDENVSADTMMQIFEQNSENLSGAESFLVTRPNGSLIK